MHSDWNSTFRFLRRRGIGWWLAISCPAVFICGCNTGTTISNAPGHVVVAFNNQTDIDEKLLNYLASVGLDASSMLPRVRVDVRITFTDQSFTIVEFVTGSENLVEPDYAAQASTDLDQPPLNNFVGNCDVARVELDPGASAEIYIPAEIIQYQLVETTSQGGQTVTDFEQRGVINPAFRPLQVDETDDRGHVTLRRNIGVRDVLSPVPDVICGSNVVITVNGTLTVPFLDPVSQDVPSVDQDDEETNAQIGGRFEFNVSVQ